VGAPLEGLQGLDPAGLLHQLPEVAFVHWSPGRQLKSELQPSEGEGGRKEGKKEGRIGPSLVRQTGQGRRQDDVVVEGQVPRSGQGTPGRLGGVRARLEADIFRAEKGEVGYRNDAPAGIAVGLAEVGELQDPARPDPGFLLHFAAGAGVEILIFLEEPAGKRPLPSEGIAIPSDEQDLQGALAETEDHDVGGDGGAGGVVAEGGHVRVSTRLSGKCKINTIIEAPTVNKRRRS